MKQTQRHLDSLINRIIESELDCMLAEAENVLTGLCVPAEKGFASFEERMGW